MSLENAIVGKIRHRATGASAQPGFARLFLMEVANLATGGIGAELPDEILETWGIGRYPVASCDAFHLLTVTLLSHDPEVLPRQLGFPGAIIGHIERPRDSLHRAILFLGLDPVGTLMLLELVGWPASLAHLAAANDDCMSKDRFRLIGLAIARWHRRCLILDMAFRGIGAKNVVSPDPLADLGHVLALGLSFALGSVPQIGQPIRTREAGHDR